MRSYSASHTASTQLITDLHVCLTSVPAVLQTEERCSDAAQSHTVTQLDPDPGPPLYTSISLLSSSELCAGFTSFKINNTEAKPLSYEAHQSSQPQLNQALYSLPLLHLLSNRLILDKTHLFLCLATNQNNL